MANSTTRNQGATARLRTLYFVITRIARCLLSACIWRHSAGRGRVFGPMEPVLASSSSSSTVSAASRTVRTLFARISGSSPCLQQRVATPPPPPPSLLRTSLGVERNSASAAISFVQHHPPCVHAAVGHRGFCSSAVTYGGGLPLRFFEIMSVSGTSIGMEAATVEEKDVGRREKEEEGDDDDDCIDRGPTSPTSAAVVACTDVDESSGGTRLVSTLPNSSDGRTNSKRLVVPALDEAALKRIVDRVRHMEEEAMEVEGATEPRLVSVLFSEEQRRKVKEYAAKKSPKQAAVLIALCNAGDEAALLLTVRSQRVGTHKGQVAFAGGHMEEGETVEATALREAREELGEGDGVLGHVRLLARLDPVVSSGGVLVHPVLGYLEKNFNKAGVQSLTPNADEVDLVFVMTLGHLLDKRYRSTAVYDTPHGLNVQTPIFNGGPKKVWGLTATVIDGVLEKILRPVLRVLDVEEGKL